MDKIRINLANPQELLEIPGIDRVKADTVVRFRVEHGPIKDAAQLTRILGRETVTAALLAHVDFDPADATAPEAPGA